MNNFHLNVDSIMMLYLVYDHSMDQASYIYTLIGGMTTGLILLGALVKAIFNQLNFFTLSIK
jgi:hypothetical protein